jgi:nucleoside-diphosphate-sugar epimerase
VRDYYVVKDITRGVDAVVHSHSRGCRQVYQGSTRILMLMSVNVRNTYNLVKVSRASQSDRLCSIKHALRQAR